jgi:hypothetical protein
VALLGGAHRRVAGVDWRPLRVCGVDQVKTIEAMFEEWVQHGGTHRWPTPDQERQHGHAIFMAGAAAMASLFAEGGFIFVGATQSPPRPPTFVPLSVPCNHLVSLSGESAIEENGKCGLCGQDTRRVSP